MNPSFTDPTLLPPKRNVDLEEIDIDTRTTALLSPCELAVQEYEEDSNINKIVSQFLQNCILESQCKFFKTPLFKLASLLGFLEPIIA